MRSFFDTNVLVYMFDEDSPKKKPRAQALFEQETAAGRAVLSTQVLQEFYVVVTRKLTIPLASEVAEEVVRNLAAFPVMQIDAPLVLAAIGRSRLLTVSFWDALVVETAITSGAVRLLTEDLQHGQVIDGMRIENPFL